MRNDGSVGNDVAMGNPFGDSSDLEKQRAEAGDHISLGDPITQNSDLTALTIPSNGNLFDQVGPSPPGMVVLNFSEPTDVKDTNTESPKKANLSRNTSSHEQCRVCQQESEEGLIDLGCFCRGGLSKAHRSCINTWFRTRGSNKCEICQQVAVNVELPESQPSTNYWVWRVDPNFRGEAVAQDHRRGCFSPLWVALSILIGGLLLDVLISITLGVSALPVNIIIGVIVVLGLGTAIRLALEFCHDWSVRRLVHRAEANINLGYHPTL